MKNRKLNLPKIPVTAVCWYGFWCRFYIGSKIYNGHLVNNLNFRLTHFLKKFKKQNSQYPPRHFSHSLVWRKLMWCVHCYFSFTLYPPWKYEQINPWTNSWSGSSRVILFMLPTIFSFSLIILLEFFFVNVFEFYPSIDNDKYF